MIGSLSFRFIVKHFMVSNVDTHQVVRGVETHTSCGKSAVITEKNNSDAQELEDQSLRSSEQSQSIDCNTSDESSSILRPIFRNKDNNKNIESQIDGGQMLSYVAINDNVWWKDGRPRCDQDNAELSSQVTRTNSGLATDKGNIIPFHLGEDFELFSKPESLTSNERCEGKEGKTCYLIENMYSVLQRSKTLVSEGKGENTDESSIASSSSSAVFEFFEDVSMLTTEEDSNCDEYVEYDNDMSLSCEGNEQSEGKDVHIMVCTMTQQFLTENKSNEEKPDFMGDFIKRRDNNTREDHIVLDFLVQSCYDDGFSPSDELRLS